MDRTKPGYVGISLVPHGAATTLQRPSSRWCARAGAGGARMSLWSGGGGDADEGDVGGEKRNGPTTSRMGMVMDGEAERGMGISKRGRYSRWPQDGRCAPAFMDGASETGAARSLEVCCPSTCCFRGRWENMVGRKLPTTCWACRCKAHGMHPMPCDDGPRATTAFPMSRRPVSWATGIPRIPIRIRLDGTRLRNHHQGGLFAGHASGVCWPQCRLSTSYGLLMLWVLYLHRYGLRYLR